jgi:hypothetical protein
MDARRKEKYSPAKEGGEQQPSGAASTKKDVFRRQAPRFGVRSIRSIKPRATTNTKKSSSPAVGKGTAAVPSAGAEPPAAAASTEAPPAAAAGGAGVVVVVRGGSGSFVVWPRRFRGGILDVAAVCQLLVRVHPARRVGTFYSPCCCASKHIQLMTPGMVHVTNRPPPGVPTLAGRMVTRHQLVTAGMVHVTNLTPGSANPYPHAATTSPAATVVAMVARSSL